MSISWIGEYDGGTNVVSERFVLFIFAVLCLLLVFSIHILIFLNFSMKDAVVRKCHQDRYIYLILLHIHASVCSAASDWGVHRVWIAAPSIEPTFCNVIGGHVVDLKNDACIM